MPNDQQNQDDRKKQIGREIKDFINANLDGSRDRFAFETGVGRGTVDKLCVGIFSEKTLQKVLQRSKFKLKSAYASKIIGGYHKANWSNYISKFLYLRYSFSKPGAIEASIAYIEWDEKVPGLMLYNNAEPALKSRKVELLGALWIYHEGGNLIFVQPIDSIGDRWALVKMIGEPIMRGLVLSVPRLTSYAYAPSASPVYFARLENEQQPSQADLGLIQEEHCCYKNYLRLLQSVLQEQYAQLKGA